MKKIHFFQISILVILAFGAACKKDSPSTGSGTVPINPPPPPPINTPPIANAGSDTDLYVPVNFCDLIGSGFDREDSILTFQWKKISGPVSFFIQNPTFKSTKLTSLEIGVYQFELTVTDRPGLSAKDTVTITVQRFPNNTQEVVFNNLTWIPIWYETLEINNFYSFIPPGTPFRVYIQRDFNPAWIEATPVATNGSGGTYEYFVETRPNGGGAGMYNYGSLYIFYYGTDVSDTPAVKIIF